MRPRLFYLGVTFIFTIFICLYLYSHHPNDLEEKFKFNLNKLKPNLYVKKPVEGTCIHPKIDVFDPEVLEYYYEIPKCTPTREPLTDLKNGRIIEFDPANFTCWARCQHFGTYVKNTVDNWSKADNASFNCDVVETRCSPKENKQISSATDFYLHTQIVEQKVDKPKIPFEGKQYSVHIILVDSTSYTQSIRNFPILRKYLLEELGAVEFPYLNKYSDGSRENMVVISFGKLQHEIDREDNSTSLVPEPKWEFKTNCNRNLDGEKRLIREFEEHGYVTNQNDDWYATLNYDCSGNIKQQSHHQFIPYVLAYENDKKLSKFLENQHCLERHQHALDYETQFLNAYKGIPKFSWTWMSHIGHNNIWKSKKAEPHLLKLFKENKNEFDDSFVFFMGDHGLRHGNVAQTRLGEYERKNPMLYVTVPLELRKNENLMEVLKQNSKELQTHFDIRATLLDILKYQPKDNYSSRETLKVPGEWGNSLLRRQPLPRNCKTLPILPEFCICDADLHLDLTNKELTAATKIGNEFVGSINRRLGVSVLKCGKWRLQRVTKLILRDIKPTRQFEADITAENERSNRTALFKVYVSEKPGGVDIKHYDRLDTFGSKGDCEKSPALKKICDCANQPPSRLK